MHLGKVQGGLKVQEWKELVHQLRHPPELFCCLRHSRHLLETIGEHWLVASKPFSIVLVLRKISQRKLDWLV